MKFLSINYLVLIVISKQANFYTDKTNYLQF